uniref:F-box/LRR-repeat protein 15-like leucin rich repeat domain-containing protein n=1 Tax=Pyramimonas obovata TaxID=1411642 RepID=A0A7S0WN02_9CHLO|mmetsp:Transcript_31443/g.68754  ORF Transcript_31443/g.68754 Transcript_31443/m.68754 type:complete len:468 (+) Transcript_31443:184-1587(+)
MCAAHRSRKRSDWADLPDLVFDKVLEQLRCDRGASATFRSVCKKWQEVHDSALEGLRVKRVPADWIVGNRLGGVKKLNLRGCDGLSDQTIGTLGSLSRLTHLELFDCKISDDHIAVLAPRLTSLTHLNLGSCSALTDEGVRALAPRTLLEKLSIANCLVTDDGIRSLAKSNTALTSLNLANCKAVTADGLQALASLTALTKLDLSFRTLTHEELGALSSIHSLNNLDLFVCGLERYDWGNYVVTPIHKVTSLNLSCSREISDEGLEKLLAYFPALGCLLLDGCTALTDKGIKNLAALTSLTTLNLSHCRSVTDVGVRSLASLSQLRTLELDSGCWSWKPEGLSALACLTSLTALNMTNCCRAFTHEGVLALCSLQSLTSLKLTASLESLDMLVGRNKCQVATCGGMRVFGIDLKSFKKAADGTDAAPLTILTCVDKTSRRRIVVKHRHWLCTLVEKGILVFPSCEDC